MKRFIKRRRPKKCAVSLSAAEAAAIDRSNDQPVDHRPKFSAGDLIEMALVLSMIAAIAAYFAVQVGMIR